MGEDHGNWEETGKAPTKILRYMGNGMYERCVPELGETLLITRQVKKNRISKRRNRILDKRESERNIVPKTAMKQNIAKGRFLTSFKFVERVSVRECHED